MEAGKPFKRCFRSHSGGKGGRRTAYTSCFLLFQTPGMKCMSEYFKATGGYQLASGLHSRRVWSKAFLFSQNNSGFLWQGPGPRKHFQLCFKNLGGFILEEREAWACRAQKKDGKDSWPMLQRAKTAILAKEFLSSDQFKHWIFSRKLPTSASLINQGLQWLEENKDIAEFSLHPRGGLLLSFYLVTTWGRPQPITSQRSLAQLRT